MAIEGKLAQTMREELRQLVTIKSSDRPWQMPFAAALASGIPLLIGAYFGRMDEAVIASLGGLVFLYLPETPMHHRMVSLMASAFALIGCYALGIMSQWVPSLMTVALTFSAILVTMVCRFYRVGPPGSLFFIMAASIGAFSPGGFGQIPEKVGLVSLGSLLACLIAFFYSLHILRRRQPKVIEPLADPTFDFVVFDSIVIGVSVGISLAQVLQLERPYWVPVSCLAVMQGISWRAVWDKQLHRLLGTAIGLLLSWALLALPLGAWGHSLLMIVLAFVIEVAVVRHYGFAAIFFTPLTILLADAPTLGQGPTNTLIAARSFDTVLGCLVGLLGGYALHSPRFRHAVGITMRQVIAKLR